MGFGRSLSSVTVGLVRGLREPGVRALLAETLALTAPEGWSNELEAKLVAAYAVQKPR